MAEISIPGYAVVPPINDGNISGTFSDGNTVIVSGSGFGTRGDNGGSESYLCRLFDDFEDGTMDAWSFTSGGSSWSIESSNVRTNSTYCAHKTNSLPLDRAQISPPSNTHYYTSFWMYLASDMSTSNNNKYFRAGSTSSNANLVWNSNSNSVNTQETVEFAVGGTQVNYGTQSVSELKSSWNFVEILWALPVLGSSDDYARVYVNNSLVNELPASGGLWTPDEQMSNSPYISIGTWFNTSIGIGSGWYYDDVYIDYTNARVMAGNASTYSACTEFDLQIPTAWSNTSITINVNQGAHTASDTVYIYVVDADNAVINENGYSVVVA